MYRYIDIRTNPEYKYDEVLGDINYNFSLLSGISGNFLSLTGGTISGNLEITGGLSATTISGGTLYSGGTDLYDIFSTSSGDIVRVQPGLNIYTGGTDNYPTVNISAATLVTLSAISVSAAVFYSGLTPLSLILNSLSGGTSASLWSASTGLNSIIANNGTGNIANGLYSNVLGGQTNRVEGIQASIVGGNSNYGLGIRSFIGGGLRNSATTSYTVVINGKYNFASGDFSTVINGYQNIVSGNKSFIGNGYKNSATTAYSIIVGGSENLAYGLSSYSFIGGGVSNRIYGTLSAVVGGVRNIVSGYSSFIGGGYQNSAATNYSAVVGGVYNSAIARNSFIGGGKLNSASGLYSSTIGGYRNIASGTSSVVGGGYVNAANGTYSVVAGGYLNIADGTRSGILAGQSNLASANKSFVGTGLQNSAITQYASVSAGFSESTSNTLYPGVNFQVIKQGIDSLFIGLKADGIYSKLIKWSPNIGGTVATHAINAITPGTLDSTYTNSPVQTSAGTQFDGTTNWENSGILPATHLSLNNFALGAIAVDDDIDLSNTDIFGAQDNGSVKTLKFGISNPSSQAFFAPATNAAQYTVAHGGSNKGFWIATRTASNASSIKKDGVAAVNSSTASVALTAFEITIGALHNGATGPSPRYTGAIRHFFAGTSFTDANALAFKNRLKTFDTILNRNILP